MKPYASKAEAQKALNDARTKAQKAHAAWSSAAFNTDAYADATGTINTPSAVISNRDAAKLHYDRCVCELEAAINDYASFDNEAAAE